MGDKVALPVEVKGEAKAIGESELLLFIYKNEGMSYDELGKKIGLDVGLVSYHVENIEAKGLIEIKREIEDKTKSPLVGYTRKTLITLIRLISKSGMKRI
jgi:DNA-binding MarR family transcriptional regulator